MSAFAPVFCTAELPEVADKSALASRVAELEARLAKLEDSKLAEETVTAGALDEAPKQDSVEPKQEDSVEPKQEDSVEPKAVDLAVEPTEEEVSMDKARDIAEEALMDSASSYFGRTQILLITEHGDRPPAWMLFGHVAFASVVIFCEMVALHSVKNFAMLVSEWEDVSR